jgi:hypothetical protein
VVAAILKDQEKNAVQQALDGWVSKLFPEPEVGELLRGQLAAFVADPEKAGPFPVVPLSLLGKAQGIFEGVVHAEAPAPGPVVFDLKALQQQCAPVKPALAPISPSFPDLQRGGLPDESVEDCTLARAQALADVLNNLALGNGSKVVDGDAEYTTPASVAEALLASGHSIQVMSKVFFADFLGLYYKGQSVAASVWIDTGVALPGGGTAKIPAPHAGYTVLVEGPLVKANLEFFLGTDGGTRFRAWSSLPRASWQGGRVLTSFDGAKDKERVIAFFDKAGKLRKKWQEEGASLPLQGYGTLGVCNDSVAVLQGVVEKTPTTLFPLAHREVTAQNDEFDVVLAKLPRDLSGALDPSAKERVIGSLPFASASEASACFPAYAAALIALGAK